MNNDPSNDKDKHAEAEETIARYEVLLQSARQLLTANEATVEEFDIDGNGDPIYELALVIDSPKGSLLNRLGYGRVEFSHVPESVDATGFRSPDITLIITQDFDRKASLDEFTITKNLENERVILVPSGYSHLVMADPNSEHGIADFGDKGTVAGFIPHKRPVTQQEEVALQAILDGCRDHVTLPPS